MSKGTALFLSPHLDDVAFSCGGLAALLADAGWHTILATVFTRSVVPAEGFALACQLDKGLGEDVDYMALRRDEDTAAAAILGIGAVHWLDLPEAPHRGYGSAAELFGSIRPDDTVAADLAPALRMLNATHRPNLVLAPQGLGFHVDHQMVTASAQAIFGVSQLAYYRDTPYAIRDPDALPLPGADGGARTAVNISEAIERKVAASTAYTTQIGFQFGGAAGLARSLRSFAVQEGQGEGPAEIFRGSALPTVDAHSLYR